MQTTQFWAWRSQIETKPQFHLEQTERWHFSKAKHPKFSNVSRAKKFLIFHTK